MIQKTVTLPKIEIFICFSIWISGVVVSLYHLYFVGQVFDHDLHDEYHYEDFAKGWSILPNRYQDQCDYEWNTWTSLTLKLLPFLILNLACAEYLRYESKQEIIPVWYASLTICVVLYFFGVTITLCLLAQALAFYVCSYLNSYLSIWIVAFLIRYFFDPEVWFKVTTDDNYLIIIASSWMILRCISFSIDKLNEGSRLSFWDFLTFLGYSLYLPLMFCGPFIPFSEFKKGLSLNFTKWDYERLKNISCKFARCLFWFVFTKFALHFIYVNAILLRPYLVKDLSDWELAGLGIAMGHFFHLKYIVFYGLPCAWAAAEGFVTPELPCCVSRVHLYSYMWRHFDQGLYQFIVKYIYIPVRNYLGTETIAWKTLASLVCFVFIYFWHGAEDFVFRWALLNFIAVTLEAIGKWIYVKPFVTRTLEGNLTPEKILRLQCLISAPLHYFSMVSNYYFIGNGLDVGEIYLKRFLSGKNLPVIIFFLYGAGQSATMIQTWQKEKENERKEKTKFD